MDKKEICPACTAHVEKQDYGNYEFYECPVCGRFEMLWPVDNSNIDRNHLAAYLAYHAYLPHKNYDGKYHTVRDKETCDTWKKDYSEGKINNGFPVHMDEEIIENWYPKTFTERIDNILLYLNKHTEHIGQMLKLKIEQILSVLFIDVKKISHDTGSFYDGKWIERNPFEYIEETNFVLNYLKEQNYIRTNINKDIDPAGEFFKEEYEIGLTPKGYARIDELQKNNSNGRSVLVAMQFGDDTKVLREAIRKGISDAGYNAVFIDEVQHNDFITPELLKHIKESKFVVVDLTHKNPGAYFEEGYAMGLGKPVIQLCKHGVKLHFDIAQKNTIMWESEEDIPERLSKRIRATID